MSEQKKITLTGRQTADKIACMEILSSAQRGEVITYQRLSEHCGRDVTRYRGGLLSARKHLEREGHVFAVLRGVGLRRMEPGEHVADSRATVIGIRRRAARGLIRATHAQTDEMTTAQRVDHAAMAGVLASVTARTEAKAIAAEKQRVIDASAQIILPEVAR